MTKPTVQPVHRAVTLAVVTLAMLCGWGALLYHLSWRAFVGDSDGANAVLAGHDIFQGNVLLRGWILPFDSYWPTELPFYGAFTAVTGVGAEAMHAVPVAVGAALVFFAAGAGRAARSGAAGVAGAGLVFILLGLPHPGLVDALFKGPQHVATTLWCLAAFVLLAHRPRSRRWWLGALLLGAAVLADAFALATGLVPLVAAGFLGAVRRRRWDPLASAIGAATVAAVVVALLWLITDAAGGHQLAPPVPTSPSSNWDNNVRQVPAIFGLLLGWDPRGGLSGAFRAVHLIGGLAFAAGVMSSTAAAAIGAARSWWPRSRTQPTDGVTTWLNDVLTLAFWGGVAAFVISSLPSGDLGAPRYLVSSLVFGTVLAGRNAAGAWAGLERRPRLVAGAAGGVLATVYLLAALGGLSRPPPAEPVRELTTWLDDHNLRNGLGTYWIASNVTVKSRQRVSIRPVIAVDGRLRPFFYYARRDWWSPPARGSGRRFLVYEADAPWGGVDEASGRASFGPPEQAERVGAYQVLIWDEDVTSRLGPPWSYD